MFSSSLNRHPPTTSVSLPCNPRYDLTSSSVFISFVSYEHAGTHPTLTLTLTLTRRYTSDFAIYNGMATATDEVFGNLTAALKSRGLYDNTIVIVISDNGGPPAKYVEEKTRCVCV